MLLNRIFIHLESRAKIIFKTLFVAGIGIYQEKRADSVVADAVAPYQLTSPAHC